MPLWTNQHTNFEMSRIIETNNLDEGQNNDQELLNQIADLSVPDPVLRAVNYTDLTPEPQTQGQDTIGSGNFQESIEEEYLNVMFPSNGDVMVHEEQSNTQAVNSVTPKSDCHVFTNIKCQPPCLAHRVLIDEVIKEATHRKCGYSIAVNARTDASTNPLSLVFKLRYLKTFFPNVTFTPMIDGQSNQKLLFNKKDEGITHIVWITGKIDSETDATLKYRDYLASTIGMTIETKYIPKQAASAHDMRQAAKFLDLRKFSALCAGGVSQYTINSLYKDVRAGMQNPTPVIRTSKDLIRIALKMTNEIYFKPVAKFNDLEMLLFKQVVSTEETQLADETSDFLKSEGYNDTIDDAVRQVIRTFRNWNRFFKFATHARQEKVTPAGEQTSLQVMRNAANKESDTLLYEYVENDVGYNTVDLRVAKVYEFLPTMVLMNDFSNAPRPKFEIKFDKSDDHVTLKAGIYELEMSSKLRVGPTEAGWIVVHPGLIKHGYTLNSRIYEFGYEGPMSIIITIPSGSLKLGRNTRVAKYMTFEAHPANTAPNQLKKDFQGSGLNMLTSLNGGEEVGTDFCQNRYDMGRTRADSFSFENDNDLLPENFQQEDHVITEYDDDNSLHQEPTLNMLTSPDEGEEVGTDFCQNRYDNTLDEDSRSDDSSITDERSQERGTSLFGTAPPDLLMQLREVCERLMAQGLEDEWMSACHIETDDPVAYVRRLYASTFVTPQQPANVQTEPEAVERMQMLTNQTPNPGPYRIPHITNEYVFVVPHEFKAKLIDMTSDIIVVEDTYCDYVPDYTLACKDFWLRQRDGKYQLKIPSDQGHEGQMRRYRTIRSNNQILDLLELPYPKDRTIKDEHMTPLLEMNGIHVYAYIKTVRDRYLPVQANAHKYDGFLSANTDKYAFQIDVDMSELHCLMSEQISRYTIGKIRVLTALTSEPFQAIADVMQSLSIPPPLFEGPPRGKLIECIRRHNPDCFNILLSHHIVSGAPAPGTTQYYQHRKPNDHHPTKPEGREEEGESTSALVEAQIERRAQMNNYAKQGYKPHHLLSHTTLDSVEQTGNEVTNNLTMQVKEIIKGLQGEVEEIEEIFYDKIPEYTISKNDTWLKRIKNKDDIFELRKPSAKVEGIAGWVPAYGSCTSNTWILFHLGIDDHTKNLTCNDTEKILASHHIKPFVRCKIKRTSYTTTLKTSLNYIRRLHDPSCDKPSYHFKISIDESTIECMITGQRSKYNNVEITMLKPEIMRATYAIEDIMGQLGMTQASLQQMVGQHGKVIECIRKYNLKCYDILTTSKVVPTREAILALNQTLTKQLDKRKILPNPNKFSFYATGTMYVNHESIDMHNVLFDTGATHASYVSEEFVEQNRDILETYIQPHNSVTILGDGKTKCHITEALVVPCTFTDNNKTQYRGTVKFSIYKTYGTHFIIGAPDICTKFRELVIQMIRSSQDEVTSTYNELQYLQESDPEAFLQVRRMNGLNLTDTIAFPEIYHDSEIPLGTNPFNISLNEIESPEEKDTPMPCSFGDPLMYLSTTHAVALEKYRALLGTNVSPELVAAVPEILEYLVSPECLEVFVPETWKGLKIEPYNLEFREDMPKTMMCKARPINPKLYENAKAEFDRMASYFYEPSNSSIAVNLVVASKPTPPFLRLCGNYPETNTYLTVSRWPIPKVELELGRIRSYKYFIDCDMMNSFHQIPLSLATSNKLSIITPWGLYRPKFLPEGVSSATSILQTTVMTIFHDFQSFMVTIFDNFLIMANSYEELFTRFKMVIGRANEFNLVLKMAKSKFGFNRVDFFGYVIENGTVRLDETRWNKLQDVKFPTKLKEMQRFLGACLFFSRFILNYSSLSAPLNEMTSKDFDWNPKTFTKDYVTHFENLKESLANSCTLHLPDYTKRFALFADASEYGVGAALTQIQVDEVTGEDIYQPIAFFSQKFSEQAKRWETIKQEAYAIYASAKHFEYYLICKPFTILTDHRNLVYIASNSSSILTRWKFYLSRFSFKVQHIKGSLNVFADCLSRSYDHPDHNPPSTQEGEKPSNVLSTTDNDNIPVLAPLVVEENTTVVNHKVTQDEDQVKEVLRFIPSEDSKAAIKKYEKEKLKEKLNDVYYDVPQEYSLTKNNLWLRKRNDKFELRCPVSIADGEEKGTDDHQEIQDYRKISKAVKTFSDIKLNSIAHGTSTKDFESILEKSIIIPLAEITSTRTTHKLHLRIGANYLQFTDKPSKHVVKVTIDTCTLKDPPAVKKQKYQVAKLNVLTSGGNLKMEHAVEDVSQQLQIDTQSYHKTKSKIAKFIHDNDTRHYDTLVVSGVIRDDSSNPDPSTLAKKHFGEDEEAFQKAFQRVHGRGELHNGVRRTVKAFNRYFPGHNVPFQVIEEAVKSCALCQMYRTKSLANFAALSKVIKPPTFRQSVGIDRVTISPASKDGNTTLIVIVNIFTKHIFAKAEKEYTATSIARALMVYYSLFGTYDILRSDKGSDILGESVSQLLKWVGPVARIVALTNRPQSSGVEKSNGKIINHLSMLCSSDKAKLIWDKPEYLNLCIYKLNSMYNDEIGMTPFCATYGDMDEEHFKFAMTMNTKPVEYVRQLHENMKLINEITSEFQQRLIQERLETNPIPAIRNRYRKGDLVLLKDRRLFQDEKLNPKYTGPYKVTEDQALNSNDISLIHVANGKTKEVYVEDIQHFYPSTVDSRPTETQALDAGQYDSDQIIIREILEYRGNYLKRSEMEFKVQFNDDTIEWKPYDNDLSSTVQFELFIKKSMITEPYLRPLLSTHKVWTRIAKEMNDQDIHELTQGKPIYIFLSTFGPNWLANLELPNISPKLYVVEMVPVKQTLRSKKKATVFCKVFNKEYIVNNEYLTLYSTPTFLADHHVLIDAAFCKKYPNVCH